MALAVVVDKWSACSPSTQMIRGLIPLESAVSLFKRTLLKEKEAGMSHFKQERLTSSSLNVASVIRFCKISPLWEHFMKLCKMFEGLFRVWQNFEPILANFNVFLGRLFMLYMAKYWKITKPSGHTERRAKNSRSRINIFGAFDGKFWIWIWMKLKRRAAMDIAVVVAWIEVSMKFANSNLYFILST